MRGLEMRDVGRDRQLLWAVLLALAVALVAAGGAVGATMHPKLLAKVGYGSAPIGFARTPRAAAGTSTS